MVENSVQDGAVLLCQRVQSKVKQLDLKSLIAARHNEQIAVSHIREVINQILNGRRSQSGLVFLRNSDGEKD